MYYSLVLLNEDLLTDALPAVTKPFSLNKVGNFFSPSMVVCGLGCSSTSKLIISFLTFNGTGAISALKTPASCAIKTKIHVQKNMKHFTHYIPAFHFCCELYEYWSTSSLVTLHCAPNFSAVNAMGNLQ